jgi:1-pyrroline-5-carboxylate dehydrogenase
LVQAGVPAGAINYLTGPGSAFGDEFSRNLDVSGIAFTGSKDVGMQLYRDFVSNQPYPKPFIAEMGSKNPAIITSKADLQKAAEGVIRGAYGYGGQKCSATSRVYVDRGIKNDFLKLLKTKVEDVKVGDPREKPVFVGPIIDEKALRKYQRAIQQAKKDGGKIIAEASFMEEKLPRGYYVKPVVVTGLPSNHKLFKEELFVPFVAVDEFKTMDEALQKANNTDFGLTAGIFTEDEKEKEYFFQNIDFGVTYANRKGGATTGAWPGAQSFGGWKGSGATGKGVGGPYYLLEFMHEQAQTNVTDTS